MSDQEKAIALHKAAILQLVPAVSRDIVASRFDRAVSISRASQGSGVTEEDGAHKAFAEVVAMGDRIYLNLDNDSSDRRAIRAFVDRFRARAALSPTAAPLAPEDVRIGAEAYAQLVREHDAQVDRLKACEHIALGDEGWEVLRNECPSTAAVAALRDRAHLLATPVTVTSQECRQIYSEAFLVSRPDEVKAMEFALRRVLGDRIQISGEPS